MEGLDGFEEVFHVDVGEGVLDVERGDRRPVVRHTVAIGSAPSSVPPPRTENKRQREEGKEEGTEEKKTEKTTGHVLPSLVSSFFFFSFFFFLGVQGEEGHKGGEESKRGGEVSDEETGSLGDGGLGVLGHLHVLGELLWKRQKTTERKGQSLLLLLCGRGEGHARRSSRHGRGRIWGVRRRQT